MGGGVHLIVEKHKKTHFVWHKPECGQKSKIKATILGPVPRGLLLNYPCLLHQSQIKVDCEHLKQGDEFWKSDVGCNETEAELFLQMVVKDGRALQPYPTVKHGGWSVYCGAYFKL